MPPATAPAKERYGATPRSGGCSPESSAKGIYYFNRIRKNGPWKGTEKPEEEWGKVECEPIVSPEVWDQVNQIMEEQLKTVEEAGQGAGAHFRQPDVVPVRGQDVCPFGFAEIPLPEMQPEDSHG